MIDMPKFIVKITGKPQEWVIEAPCAYDAKTDAVDTYLNDHETHLEVECEEIEENTVRHDRLTLLLEQLVEGFNDCACCPLSNDCACIRREADGIVPYECARLIRMFYLEQETDWGIG